jgi:hypothetical protein
MAKTKRSSGSKKGRSGITFEEFWWGAIFTGTAESLIRAGLLSKKHIPTRGKDTKYKLPLNHHDGYMAACYGPTPGKIQPSWDAKAARSLGAQELVSVYVEYNQDDLDTEPRIKRALQTLESLNSRSSMGRVTLNDVAEDIRNIAPRSVAESLREWIERSKDWPTEKQREAWRRQRNSLRAASASHF